jgi:copper chaperone
MKLHILIAGTVLLASSVVFACENVTVEGMTCEGCAKSIRQALMQNPAVADVKVDHESGLVEIHCKKGQKMSRKDIEGAIKAAGEYTVKPAGKAVAPGKKG